MATDAELIDNLCGQFPQHALPDEWQTMPDSVTGDALYMSRDVAGRCAWVVRVERHPDFPVRVFLINPAGEFVGGVAYDA